MNNSLKAGILYPILGVIFSLAGCAAIETTPEQKLSKTKITYCPINGKYHKIEKNQTLWKISKMYGIDLEEIIKSNNITDPAQIKLGQAIFIPDTISRMRTDNNPRHNNSQDFIWPARGRIISNFGERTNNVANKGITLSLGKGCDIVAADAGTVVFTAEDLKGYGKTIILSHNDGIITVYSLLSRILVQPGDYIQQGLPIAKSENGLVHFEVRKGYLSQNPNYYLPH